MIDLVKPVLDFFQSPIFQQMGIFGLLIYSAMPSFLAPLPNETISAPLLIGGMSPIIIVIVMSIGSLLGDLLMFYLGKHVRRLFHKKVENAKPSHFMHRHRYWIFVLAVPIPYLSESVMALAGHQHLNLKKIIPFIYLGELLRAVVGTSAVLGILSIPEFL